MLDFDWNALINLLYTYVPRLLALFICLPLHEFAHGFMAYKLGDSTAKREGRLTLNPFAHLDLFGSLCLVFGGFGWAKPVPVNPFNLRNKKGGTALVALAGPISNLILMLASALLARGIFIFAGISRWINAIGAVFYTLAQINLCLAVFNLLPVPPLDGSKVLYHFLPNRLAIRVQQNEHIISMVFMAIIILENIGVLAYGIGDLLSLIVSPIWMGLRLLLGM